MLSCLVTQSSHARMLCQNSHMYKMAYMTFSTQYSVHRKASIQMQFSPSCLQISEDYLSEPVTIEYPTDNGQMAFMNYYPPKNQDYQLPPGETPPLLVKIHGGPTSQASTAFNLGYQYWTSRG